MSTSALRGKAVVLSFWATWCRYCMKELSILGGLQATAEQRGLPLQVVEINYEKGHRTFARASHLLMPKLPGLLLTWDKTGALAKSFGLGGALPAMIMLHATAPLRAWKSATTIACSIRWLPRSTNW